MPTLHHATNAPDGVPSETGELFFEYPNGYRLYAIDG